MMDYANRVKDILLRDYFDEKDGFTISTGSTRKNNGVVLSGITIMCGNEIASPNFYIDVYKEKGFSEEAAAEAIFQSYKRHLKESREVNQNKLLEKLTSFPDMKDYICYKLVNRKTNQELFQNAPHLDVNDDLAVVYYLQIARGATAVINNQMLDVWQISKENVEDYLWQFAKKNTVKRNPPEFKSLISILMEDMSPEEKEMLGANMSGGITEMYVLTNKDKIFGASTLLYKDGSILQDCVKQIEETTGTQCKGIFILPSSIHEIIILPDNGAMNKEELMQMVQEVNSTQVMQHEVLSDNVFYYNDESGFQQLTYTQRELAR